MIQKILKYWRQNIKMYTTDVLDEADLKYFYRPRMREGNIFTLCVCVCVCVCVCLSVCLFGL